MKPMVRLVFLASFVWLNIAGEAGDGLVELREKAHQSHARLELISGRQTALTQEHAQLAARIEALKKEPSKLLRNAELNRELKRSQELSAELTQLARVVSAARAASEQES